MTKKTAPETKPQALVTAARLEYESYLVNAWRNSEFRLALHSAAVAGVMEPLASYLESAKTLTQEDRHTLAGFIRSLEKQKPGRPRGRPTSEFYEAQRNTAYLVRLGQQLWCRTNNRQRVPVSITNTLIFDAIELALSAWPAAKIDAADIRRLLTKKVQ